MKSKTALLISVGLFLLAAVIFTVLRFNGFGTGNGEIILPQNTVAGSEGEDIALRNLRSVEEITIDKSNVKSVVKTLLRPAEYDMTASLSYGGDSGLETRIRAKNGLFRITLYSNSGNILKNTILTPSDVYIWGSESQSYFKGKRGDMSEDDEARIPTYEDIEALTDDEIIDAALVDAFDRQCVKVRSKEKDTGIERSYYVDVANGLLCAFDAVIGDETVFEMRTLSLELSDVSDNWFMLPSGAPVE